MDKIFDKKEIRFDLAKKKQDIKLTLILPDDIAKEIKQEIENNNKSSEGYIFVNNEAKIDGFKRNIRTYLERNSNKIIKNLSGKDITLATHDFRRLRGQHLYLSGFDLEVIQSLYAHNSLDQTIEYLQIKEIEVNRMLIKDLD